jgi:hypothetical protein
MKKPSKTVQNLKNKVSRPKRSAPPDSDFEEFGNAPDLVDLAPFVALYEKEPEHRYFN